MAYESKIQRRIRARRLFQCDYKHEMSAFERENCGAEALKGYQSIKSKKSEGRFKEPNYAGWQRVYVESGFPIPKKYKQAFDFALTKEYDNQAFAEALKKDVKEYGYPQFY